MNSITFASCRPRRNRGSACEAFARELLPLDLVPLVGLVVGHVNNIALRGAKPITEADAGMIAHTIVRTLIAPISTFQSLNSSKVTWLAI